MSTQLEQIAAKAKTDRTLRFTSLAHLLTPEFLKETWRQITGAAQAEWTGDDDRVRRRELETRVQDICSTTEKLGPTGRRPCGRVDIPKALQGRHETVGHSDGRRPIGSACGRAHRRSCVRGGLSGLLVWIRPGRSPHHALRTLRATLVTKKVRHLYEARHRGYLDAASHYTPLLVGFRKGGQRG